MVEPLCGRRASPGVRDAARRIFPAVHPAAALPLWRAADQAGDAGAGRPLLLRLLTPDRPDQSAGRARIGTVPMQWHLHLVCPHADAADRLSAAAAAGTGTSTHASIRR